MQSQKSENSRADGLQDFQIVDINLVHLHTFLMSNLSENGQTDCAHPNQQQKLPHLRGDATLFLMLRFF